MHILFLSDNFPPEVNAPASRTFEHCREWVKAGHRVTVITCAPNFPTGKVFPGYCNALWKRETVDGVHVVRVWSYITANEGTLKRTLDYVSFMVSAVIAALFIRRVDIVVATSPQFFTACAGYAATRLLRKPFIFELRDMWPESIRAVGALKNRRLLDALEKLELFLYRKADAVIAVTRAFRENLIARGIDGEKIFVITNGADLSRFSPMPKDQDLAKQLGLEGKFVAGYIGTHGMAHALETLLDSAAMLARDPRGADTRLLFLGDGSSKKKLEAAARDQKLDNVIFVGTVSKQAVPQYWSLLDAAIIHLKNTQLFATVIPSKLFECMAMGIPVLHGVAGESAEIVQDGGFGILFPPEDAAKLTEAIFRLVENPQERDALSQNARAASRKYARTLLASAMLDILEQIKQRHAEP